MQNKREKLNNNKKQILTLTTSFMLLIVSATVLLTAIFIWTSDNKIFGWLIADRTPSSHIFNTNINHGYDVDIGFDPDGGTHIDFESSVLLFSFDNIFAGAANSKTLTITHTNNEARDISISWWFGANNFITEIPYENEGQYYYVGSQIAVTNMEISIEQTSHSLLPDQTPGKGKFLVATLPLGGGQVTSVSNPITNIDKLELIENVILPSNKTAIITFTFTFVDNGEDQSIYQDFAGLCSRALFFRLGEVDA